MPTSALLMPKYLECRTEHAKWDKGVVVGEGGGWGGLIEQDRI